MPTVDSILARKGQAVRTVHPSDSVLDAAIAMNDHGIGGVVVVEGERAVGIFTERDILRRVVAAQRDPAATRVGEVMTSPVVVCRRHTSLDECRALISRHRVRHLPIIDDGKLCGIVTIGDILAQDVSERETTIEFLETYICGRAEAKPVAPTSASSSAPASTRRP